MDKRKAIQWDYEMVKTFVEGKEGNGCKLLSDEYVRANNKIMFLCACGSKFEVSFSKFNYRNKRQCNKCSGTEKITYEIARDIFESKGYIPLFTKEEYVNRSTKVDVETKDGYRINTSVLNVKISTPIYSLFTILMLFIISKLIYKIKKLIAHSYQKNGAVLIIY